MKALLLLAVLVVAGYGVAWMVGGPHTANRYLRFVLRGAARAMLWGIGLVFRFAGWLIRVVGGGIPRFVGRRLGEAGRRLPQLLRRP